MVTFAVGVYDIVTGKPIANAACTISATPQPSVGIALYGSKQLVRYTDINGQVMVDATAFGFLVYEDGMYWDWNVTTVAAGYQNQSTGTSSTPGNNAYVVAKMTPTPVAPMPAPSAGASPTPTQGSIVIPPIPNPITDAITQADTSVNKTITTVSKSVQTTLIIGAIILVAVIVIAFMLTPRSPTPAAELPGQSSDRVQVRSVRVGAAGFDPGTRSVGAKDVEVKAR